MDAPAPFIVRGEFIYHDTLFVDVGGALKRHARASPSEIKMFLDGKAPKDQVAHWYEAQLIHYGLQRSKDKNTAKVRLQQALSQRKLTVPAHIVEIEVQMKKEYASSINKARSAADRAARVGAEDSAVSTARKRKQSKADPELGIAASKKTKITMKVGDVEVSIERDLPGTTSTGTSREIAKGKTFSSGSTMASPLAKGKAANTPASTRKPPKTPQSRRTLQQNLLSPSVPAFAPPRTPTRSVISPSRVSTPQQTRVKAEPRVKREPTAGYLSPSKAPPKIKAEVKPETSPISRSSSRIITGVYNVTSPQLSEQYGYEANDLRVFLCVDNESNKISGGFELVPKSGVLCIDIEHMDTDAQMSFCWRARDSHRGGLSFGRGCYGDIQFFEDRRFTATVFNMFPEPVELRGERRPGPLWCGRSAWQFKRDWGAFVKETYGSRAGRP